MSASKDDLALLVVIAVSVFFVFKRGCGVAA